MRCTICSSPQGVTPRDASRFPERLARNRRRAPRPVRDAVESVARASPCGAGPSVSFGVPTGSRADRSQFGISTHDREDASARRLGQRPPSHAADAHARSDAGRPHRGASAATQRRPDRSDRARTRHRSPAVRTCGGRRAECTNASRRRVRSQSARAIPRRRTRRSLPRFPWAEPDVRASRSVRRAQQEPENARFRRVFKHR